MRRLLTLVVALAAFLWPASAEAGFVNRSADDVSWAIGKSQPTLAESYRLKLAAAVIKTAREHNFDPLTAVTIIHHESRWRAWAVSPDGEDHGLGQIRARFVKGCRADADPVHAPSAACKAAKVRLLDPFNNIRAMGTAISSWRKLCKNKTTGTGRQALFHRWLAGYGGMHRPKRGIRCGQRKEGGKWRDLPIRPRLRRIIRYRKSLIHQLKRRRRRKRS